MRGPLVPFIAFVVLLIVGRQELGPLKIIVLLVSVVAAFIIFAVLNIPMYYLTPLIALLDIILILVIFGKDIQLR
jgi:hypothetical protein